MAFDALLLALAALGHVVFWVGSVNRLHGLGLPRWTIRLYSGCCWAMMLAIPSFLALSFAHQPTLADALRRPLHLVYLVPCWIVAIYALAERTYELIYRPEHSSALLSSQTKIVDLVQTLGRRPTRDWKTDLISRLPGNEVWHVRVHEKALHVPRLAPELDGLVIAHLSDVHMNVRLEPDFYREIVRLTNELEPDLIAITGDLFDSNACHDWIADTFARLKARYGVYFVLGNHDLRIDAQRSRKLLAEAGLIDLGGCFREACVAGGRLLLAGNELPWFSPAADMEHVPSCTGTRPPLRVLLSHSPDQIDWARRYDFDLMLAGHTHGGQVRFPLAGPVLAPSRLGTKFTAGTFYLAPTVMHVSRGISGMTPLRWNCPPELSRLVLRAGIPVEVPEQAAQLAHVSG